MEGELAVKELWLEGGLAGHVWGLKCSGPFADGGDLSSRVDNIYIVYQHFSDLGL